MALTSFLHYKRHHAFSHHSPDNINKEQREQLFPQPVNVQPHKSNVEQVSKSNNELIDKIFEYDTIFIPLPGLVSFHFGQHLHSRSVHILIEPIGHQDMHYIGDLAVEGAGVKDAPECSPG